jgi:hypothetical protein
VRTPPLFYYYWLINRLVWIFIFIIFFIGGWQMELSATYQIFPLSVFVPLVVHSSNCSFLTSLFIFIGESSWCAFLYKQKLSATVSRYFRVFIIYCRWCALLENDWIRIWIFSHAILVFIAGFYKVYQVYFWIENNGINLRTPWINFIFLVERY